MKNISISRLAVVTIVATCLVLAAYGQQPASMTPASPPFEVASSQTVLIGSDTASATASLTIPLGATDTLGIASLTTGSASGTDASGCLVPMEVPSETTKPKDHPGH